MLIHIFFLHNWCISFRIKTQPPDSNRLYEPLQTRVDRVFFEANEIKQKDPQKLNFTSNKEIQLNKNLNFEEKENLDTSQFSFHKLIPQIDDYK